MFRNSFRILAGAAVCLTLTLLAMQPAATAQPPDPVIRTFGHVGLAAQAAPDFLGANSHSVTALPDRSGNVIPFMFSSMSPIFGGTEWRTQTAHHAAPGNEGGLFVWKVTEEAPDVPTVGAHTFTGNGPNSLVYEVDVFHIRLCTASDVTHGRCESGDAGNKWTVTNDTSAPYFTVVTALFSK